MSFSVLHRPADLYNDARPVPRVGSVLGSQGLVPIDQDVLAYFQAYGPGWQDRLNKALRRAVGLREPGPVDEGLRPDQLTSENDG